MYRLVDEKLAAEIHHARILVVDDESANLRILGKMLQQEGYDHLVFIQDPREVERHYQSERTDLLLLDLSMPHMDGYQVMARIKAIGSALPAPIIVLTANSERETLVQALRSGARDFLAKPFDRSELLARVHNLLEAQMAHRMLHQQKEVLAELVTQRTRELRETRLQVVQRLGRAAEYRDNETGNHIIRMSRIAALLAQHLGFDRDQCELMLHASPMHDIGKIAIPDQILLKPGRLDEGEMAVMRTHTTLGASLLDGDDSELMRMAREIALTHHERWDGQGYPQGLEGSAIPITGRICAVADVFDALTATRPYKRPWSLDEALEYLREGRGRHFDPGVIDCFNKHLDEVEAIRAHYQDPTHAPA